MISYFLFFFFCYVYTQSCPFFLFSLMSLSFSNEVSRKWSPCLCLSIFPFPQSSIPSPLISDRRPWGPRPSLHLTWQGVDQLHQWRRSLDCHFMTNPTQSRQSLTNRCWSKCFYGKFRRSFYFDKEPYVFLLSCCWEADFFSSKDMETSIL